MHAATQIQPQFHGLGTAADQPIRRRRGQVEGYNVVIPQCSGEHRLGTQLVIPGPEANQTRLTAVLQFLTKMIDACVTQGRRSTLQRLTVYSLGAAGAANLECRVWCVQVGRGVVKAEQDHTEDHEILPEGIAIEHGKLVS